MDKLQPSPPPCDSEPNDWRLYYYCAYDDMFADQPPPYEKCGEEPPPYSDNLTKNIPLDEKKSSARNTKN